MLVTAAPAQAATFTVTTTADTAGASGCTATLCTVRTAIAAAAANGNGADDLIVLPAGTYAVTAASRALTVPNNATRITNAVDVGAFTVCTSPFTTAPLDPGLHTFTVRAVDSFGNVDATPERRTFTQTAQGEP